MKRFKFIDNGQCPWCDAEEQSKEHLFVSCGKVINFWDKVIGKFAPLYAEQPNDLERLVGLYTDNTSLPIRSFITMCVRRYIYHCNVHNTELSIFELIRRISNLQKVEYYIAERNYKPEALAWHLSKWNRILAIIDSP